MPPSKDSDVKREFRVSWRRTDGRLHRKLYQTRKGADDFRDALVRLDEEPEDFEIDFQERNGVPRLVEEPTIESREVGAWE